MKFINVKFLVSALILLFSLLRSSQQELKAETGDIDQEISTELNKERLKMQFKGSSPQELKVWQAKFKAKLNSLLGDTSPPKNWKVVQEEVKVFKDFTRHQLLLQAANFPSVPIYLLVPNRIKPGDKRPAVLALHGHGRYGYDPIVGRVDFKDANRSKALRKEIDRLGYDYGLEFVKRGYVVLAPCMLPFGRRVQHEKYGRNDPCGIVFARLQAIGQLLLSRNIRDLKWCLDYLVTRHEVDPERIGCVGLSYGGRTTMFLAALDDRIKVAAPSGVLNLLIERIDRPWGCGAQIIPGLLKYGDHPEIAALIAPRPVVWEAGSKDPLLPAPQEAEFRRRLKVIYKAAGVPDKLLFDDFEGGHEWKGKKAYELFDEVLKAKRK